MNWLAVVSLSVAAVCRYTVRDVGFVDLVGPLYELALVAPETHALSADERERLNGMSTGARVSWRRVDAVREPEYAVPGRGAGWVLHRAGLAALFVGELQLDVEAIVARVESSPLRDAILSESLTSFGFLVLFESGDARDDARAHAVLAAAVAEFPDVARGLPRPVERPLRRLVSPAEGKERERVLRWSLGLSAEDEGPAVVVLFGRGQLAGEPLIGDAIDVESVLARLALVGESCECTTDPFLHVRPPVPLNWSERHRRRAAEELGFDPESPFVKAEIAGILSRTGTSAAPLELGVGFGYRETELAPRGALEPLAALEAEPERRPVVIDAGAGDWAFADEEPAEGGLRPDASDDDRSLAPIVLVLGSVVLLSLLAAVGTLRWRRAS